MTVFENTARYQSIENMKSIYLILQEELLSVRFILNFSKSETDVFGKKKAAKVGTFKGGKRSFIRQNTF